MSAVAGLNPPQAREPGLDPQPGLDRRRIAAWYAAFAGYAALLAVFSRHADQSWGIWASGGYLLAAITAVLYRRPVPQREALRIAFGLAAGPQPDRFLVGLAVLSLVSEVAAERPLVCVIDDEQWLDHASAQALGFAARRLAADPVGLVISARVPGEELTGLRELTVAGLPDADARALLESALPGPLDARVRDLIVSETGGNP